MKLTVDVTPPFGDRNADRLFLEQVLMNVVDGIKKGYIGQGDSITLDVSDEPVEIWYHWKLDR